MAGEQIMVFGGVKLDRSEVAKTSTKLVENPKTYKQETVFCVQFKNGVKAAYRKSDNNAASIYSSRTYQMVDDTKTTTRFVEGLELKGNSKGQNTINVIGGSIVGVDVADNGGGDDVTVDRAEVSNSRSSGFIPKLLSGGNVLTDKNDNTQIKNFGDSDYTRKGTIITKYKEPGVRRIDINL